MSSVLGVGLLIKYTLISGQEQISKYGRNDKLLLLGLNRHEWGEIHLNWISFNWIINSPHHFTLESN